MKRLNWHIWVYVGLAFLVYLPAINGSFVWDDEAHVTNNVTLKTLQGLWDIWFRPGLLAQYYPLTYSSFWINYRLGGLNPIGYHVVNIFLHVLNSLLVWRLFGRLKIPGAWLAGLLFLIHPVHVESVAWISERKNVLSGFFYLSAFLSYLRFKEKNAGPWIWYFSSFFLFLGALLSKTVTATLPAAILIVLWWKEMRIPWKDFARLIPFFCIAAPLGALTMKLETNHIITVGVDEWTFSTADRILIAGRALWFYLGKLLWPHPFTLSFIYPRWEIDPSALWQWLFPLSFIILLFVLWACRSRLGWGPFTALIFFALTLFPALGFKNYYPMRFSFVANHFQYLAMIGPLACAVSYIQKLSEQHARAGKVFIATVLLACGIITLNESKTYQNLEILWRDTLSKNPACWMAHNNLGTILLQSDRDHEAERHFREAIRLKPDFDDAYNNLGGLMVRRQRLIEAVDYYYAAIRFQPNAPDFHSNLCAAFLDLARLDESIASCHKAIELNPQSAPAYRNLGSALVKKGEIENAMQKFREALTIDPEYAEAYASLGIAFFADGKIDEAIIHYQKALQLDPADAMTHNNLAVALKKKNDFDQAELHYREALRFDPNSVVFRNNYASFLIDQERSDEAINQYNEVLRLDPQNPDAQRNLRRLAFDFMIPKSNSDR